MVLELKDVVKNYNKRVLDHVNCTFKSGVYGLLGPNGSGKSTLIRLICHLEVPTEGKISLDGVSIDQLDKQYRSILGYVPQKAGYYPDFTASDYLNYLCIMKGIPYREAKKRIENVLMQVNLSDTGLMKIKDFSGGMKQRLSIAQAILNNPEILLLDEPTVGLDLEERMKFKQFISEYSGNKIVILVTHIISDIEDIGNEIIILGNGKIKAHSTPEELLSGLKGKVWECICTKEEAIELRKIYSSSNVKVKGNCVELRLIADSKPMENSFMVEGDLQDLYLSILDNVKAYR